MDEQLAIGVSVVPVLAAGLITRGYVILEAVTFLGEIHKDEAAFGFRGSRDLPAHVEPGRRGGLFADVA